MVTRTCELIGFLSWRWWKLVPPPPSCRFPWNDEEMTPKREFRKLAIRCGVLRADEEFDWRPARFGDGDDPTLPLGGSTLADGSLLNLVTCGAAGATATPSSVDEGLGAPCWSWWRCDANSC